MRRKDFSSSDWLIVFYASVVIGHWKILCNWFCIGLKTRAPTHITLICLLSNVFLASCWLSPVGGVIWGFVGPAVAVIGVSTF